MSDALTIATGGMNAAALRLDAAAGRISTLGTGAMPDAAGSSLPPAATVDLSATVLDMISAQTGFAMNVAVARTANTMAKQVLDILA